jgi:GT2 family glycosyltransferase
MTQPEKPVALVLETNNLRGGGGDGAGGDHAERATSSVARLLTHLRAQTRPLASLAELVITHDGLDAVQQARLAAAAGRAVRFVRIGPDVGYYEAKNRGFDATRADVVVFADADCWPAPAWLAELLTPFGFDAGTAVTAGRTTYRDDVLGAAATSMDFMYFPSAIGAGCTRNFYANNVAFARDVFARFRYEPAPDVYRGHCQQLGMRLAAAGVPVRYVHAAHTVHRFPDSVRELLRLRLLRGTDTAAMAPHFARALLPGGLRWLGRTGALSPMLVLGARAGFSTRALASQGMRGARGARGAAAFAVMCGLSAVDAAGALGRAVLKRDFGVRDGGLVRGALSYHGDADGLADTNAAPAS